MKIHGCGWRIRRGIGRRSFGCWRKRMSKNENMTGIHDYMTHISDAASFEAFTRHEANPLLSAETLPESGSLIDFRAFAQEYPDRLFPLLRRLRPEFVEIFAEFWLLGKSQSFIGHCHGRNTNKNLASIANYRTSYWVADCLGRKSYRRNYSPDSPQSPARRHRVWFSNRHDYCLRENPELC